MNAIIIDDHPLAIAAIRNLLIKNDIEILAELTEGGSAVQRVETLKPDIVIIDVVLDLDVNYKSVVFHLWS